MSAFMVLSLQAQACFQTMIGSQVIKMTTAHKQIEGTAK